MNTGRWEYRYEKGPVIRGKAVDELIGRLNAQGAEGWEIAGVSTAGTLGAMEAIVFLKRPRA